MFVADFIGAPAMNFIPFAGAYAAGARRGRDRRGAGRGAAARARPSPTRALLCGVRPEHVRFDDALGLRAEVVGSEYLGHSQIVTVTTAVGSTLRAKVGAAGRARSAATTSAWPSTPRAVSLFDQRERPRARRCAARRAHG